MTMDDLIAALEKGPGSRELSDRVLRQFGWQERPPHVGGILLPGIWTDPAGGQWVPDERPDPSRKLQDAVDLVPAQYWSSGTAGAEREEWTLHRPQWCGGDVKAEAPTPALARCIAIIRSKGDNHEP